MLDNANMAALYRRGIMVVPNLANRTIRISGGGGVIQLNTEQAFLLSSLLESIVDQFGNEAIARDLLTNDD